MKYCSDTNKTIPDNMPRDDHVCRLCGAVTFRVRCSYCKKYSCLKCNIIEHELQPKRRGAIYTKCHECCNVTVEQNAPREGVHCE